MLAFSIFKLVPCEINIQISLSQLHTGDSPYDRATGPLKDDVFLTTLQHI
jgi:hypothetical protein